MADQRKGGIAWTEETWNYLRGCDRESPGCLHCYAEVMASRFCGPDQPYEGVITDGRWNGNLRWIEDKFDEPLRWKRARMIFVNSMSDTFHESQTNEDIAAAFGIMAARPDHLFQVLTKRADRMLKWYRWIEKKTTGLRSMQYSPQVIAAYEAQRRLVDRQWTVKDPREWPLPNVISGVTVENQEWAERRVPLLLQVPGYRFLSIEPLLGPISLKPWLGQGIHQVVVGGESGAGARPMNPVWILALRDECLEAGVPFMFKQWGAWAPALEARDDWGLTLPSGNHENWGTWRPDGTWAAGVLSAKDGHTGMARFPGKSSGRILDGRVHLEGPRVDHPLAA